jgi:uncharacterized membrane protein YeaQ/YmgE (transglycosylase-associated protein family)
MSFLGLISWCLFGLIVGVVAKLLMPGRDRGGCVVTGLLGIGGALLGGLISTWLGFGGVDVFEWRSLVIAILGAVLLLAVYRALRGR